MGRIDRLGWTAGISFEAYGTRFGIRVNDPSILECLLDYLPLGWKVVSSPDVDILYSIWVGEASKRKGLRHYNLLYGGAAQLVRSQELDEVFGSLESNLQLLTAYLAEGYLFVHAGVVGWQGQAIVMPGRSFVGKTTLVAALVKMGATYYSDEYTVLDLQGRVHPYPIPLSVRDETGKSTHKYQAEDLGGRVGQKPLPVGLIVMTEYQAGARWRPRPVSPGQAVLALVDNTVAARRDPEFSLPILRKAISTSVTIKTKRGDAKDIVELLLGLLPVC